MYCKNCGREIASQAVVCVGCGTPVHSGTNFCPNCGNQTHPAAVICTSCGVPLTNGEAKSKLVAGLLGVLLGSLGVHNFYLGYTAKAIIQVVLTAIGVISCGFFFIGPLASYIWGLVEGIMILTGNIKTDAKGVPLKD